MIDPNEIANQNNTDIIDKNLYETLMVGRSFCGKTHLFLKILKLKRLDNPRRILRIVTRSPEQYVSVEEVVQDLEPTTNHVFS